MDRAPGTKGESGMRWALFLFGLARRPQQQPPTVRTLWGLALGGILGLALMLLADGPPYYLGVGLFVGCGGTAVGSSLRRWREARRSPD